jgi:DNA-binding protein YbaB
MAANRPSINDLLNVSTPYAPTSEDEVRNRLSSDSGREVQSSAAAEMPVAPEGEGSSAPPEGHAGPPASDLGGSGEPPVTEVVSGAPTLPPDDGTRDLKRMEYALATARGRLADLEEALGGRHVQHASPDGRVRVVADVYGGILELHIDPHALRGGPARTLGRSLVHAIHAARSAGAELRERVIADVHPGDGEQVLDGA